MIVFIAKLSAWLLVGITVVGLVRSIRHAAQTEKTRWPEIVFSILGVVIALMNAVWINFFNS